MRFDFFLINESMFFVDIWQNFNIVEKVFLKSIFFEYMFSNFMVNKKTMVMRFLVVLTLFFFSVNAQVFENIAVNGKLIRCSMVEHEHYLKKKFPKRTLEGEFENWLKPLVEKYKLNRSESGGIITIPVVVHVVHNGIPVGTGGANIDDLQVISQIEVLNNDFRKQIGSPGYNLNPVGVDTQIQFELAKQDPNGNPTNGIDRVYFNHDKWTEEEIEEILKPQTIWNTSEPPRAQFASPP